MDGAWARSLLPESILFCASIVAWAFRMPNYYLPPTGFILEFLMPKQALTREAKRIRKEGKNPLFLHECERVLAIADKILYHVLCFASSQVVVVAEQGIEKKEL